MGLNFRKLLITELERRRSEIDSTLHFLRGCQPEDGSSSGKSGSSETAAKPVSLPRAERWLDREILGLRQNGLTLRAIAKQVQISHAGVWKVLRRLERHSVE